MEKKIDFSCVEKYMAACDIVQEQKIVVAAGYAVDYGLSWKICK